MRAVDPSCGARGSVTDGRLSLGEVPVDQAEGVRASDDAATILARMMGVRRLMAWVESAWRVPATSARRPS